MTPSFAYQAIHNTLARANESANEMLSAGHPAPRVCVRVSPDLYVIACEDPVYHEALKKLNKLAPTGIEVGLSLALPPLTVWCKLFPSK